MGNTKFDFPIKHDLVNIPDYLEMVTTFTLVHPDPDQPENITTSTYDLIKHDDSCGCHYAIFDLNIPFNYIDIDIKLYTGIGFGLFAHFKARINAGYQNNINLFVDEDKKVGFPVTFVFGGTNFIQPS